jgi:sulfide dehydrogenase [flavocytochrome c] flavoprotein subunit
MSKMGTTRRKFISYLGGVALLPYVACSTKPKARVVIVGGGFAGAVCANYIKSHDPAIEVLLVEKQANYMTCPTSNYVIGGFNKIQNISYSYAGLKKSGIQVIHDELKNANFDEKFINLSNGQKLFYDRLVLALGIDFDWSLVEGYGPQYVNQIPHAWKAGPQTTILSNQIQSMRNGGLAVIAAPEDPYRCPPAPYERASLIASYFKKFKPKSKIIILDSKDQFTKKELFLEGWDDLYPGMIEWVPRSSGGHVSAVNPKDMTIGNDSMQLKANVINLIPHQTASEITLKLGLADKGGWCTVNNFTFESKSAPYVHIIGDSIDPGDMPKSAFAANSQAKVAAAAIIALINEKELPMPVFSNVCYSLLSSDYGISINASYRSTDTKIRAIDGSGGTSPLGVSRKLRMQEARHARGWYKSITDETFF